MKLARLGEVAEIVRDGIAPEKIVAGTPYLGLEHIESGGRIISSAPVANGELASTKFQFGPEHLLYGKLRPYLAKIALPDFAGICSTDILPVKAGPDLDKRYLAFFLRQPKMVDFANSRASGANLPRLSPKALADFEIPLPPLPEQRRIAGILDQADALRRLRRQSLSRLSDLGQAIFYEMFDDGDRTHPIVELADLIDPSDKLNYGVVQPGHETETGVPLLRAGDILQPDLNFAKVKRISPEIEKAYTRSRLKGTEILIACVGTIGSAALATEKLKGMNIVRALARVPLDNKKANRLFIFEQIRSERVQRYYLSETRTVSQPTLNIKQIKETKIFLPPMDSQVAFAERMSKLAAMSATHTTSLAQSDSLFAALQHRAFRGEL